MGIGTGMYRRMLLSIAGRRTVERLAAKYGGKLASRFIAGDSREEALAVAADLNKRGILVTLDHLGEGIRRLEEASSYRDEYVELVRSIAKNGVLGNVSLKPTQMGLVLDAKACYGNIRSVVLEARKTRGFVRIDMEDSPYTQATIDIVRRLHAEGLTNVGTVLQAYLYRSEQDAAELTKENIRLRLVKGAYKEPASIAYQRSADVIANLRKIAGSLMSQSAYVAIGSHDDRIINWVRDFAASNGIAKDAFEFQMLYGLRMGYQEKLASEGYRVRCYVPYGVMWYPYFTRRLAEKPANLWMVVKHSWR
ncbi:proline dehydrogenase family protein [Cohnella lubricantis]|uniref:proline dehydrogenase n=1 Tax=Cohnella lubricantis TaxID=2163172 RepID=A0A841TBP0_9BACL|nr:proline dehydrogenase family protein [Cohnella lubricantis]MBB6677445.1 proline dehydrogenase family protein [Cohnella lubricantis]MBP2116669.1 proline dehydrogenase [Cohnella lubricantis]